MKTTRCKFKCNHVTDHGEAKDVNMSPVIGGSEENKSFWKYSPGGSFNLSWINKEVNFIPGKEYYLDITEANNEEQKS